MRAPAPPAVRARALVQPPRDPSSLRFAPDGFHMEWVASENWRVATGDEQLERHCRRPGCRRAPVAALNRGYHTRTGRRDAWWLYCDWHLYGRRVANGRVEHLRAVENE